ncbi:stalk domain-containing protein [Acetivibrio thermocellus]|uniref:stalk domain-containing protein n=1 Tax=Acetivibrio thermocellus TaxID=1515 RepID=UPI001F394DCA|nr:stalk domain-containing protein [Acetivibrio thermocellus]HOP93295.1 stalk domain-containing protein [Acetivibrio thermocellus]
MKILKRKTFLQIFALMGVFVLCSGVIAFGSSLTTEIKAILSREVTIKYEGEVQNMKDGLGNPVYPLMYNGTTYLPIRAVSNMLNIPIEWEAATKTVILGTEEKQPKSVLSFKAKSSNFASKVTDKGSLVIKGNSGEEIKYNDGICYKIWNATYSSSIDKAYKAEIGGKYSKLCFDAYIHAQEEYIGKKFKLVIYDVDDNSVRTKIEIVAGEIKELEVNIEGVNTIGFAADYDDSWGRGYTGMAYFFNPTVK